MRFVVRLACWYAHRTAGMDADDLVNEGVFAFPTAIKKFRAKGGATFLGFASHYIRNEMRRACGEHVGARPSVWRRRHLYARYDSLTSQGMSHEDAVARLTDETGLRVVESTVRELSEPLPLSLDMNVCKHPECKLIETLRATGPAADERLDEARMVRRLRTVTMKLRSVFKPMDRTILDRRLLAVDRPLSLREVGRLHDRSHERVRQREQYILAVIRKMLVERKKAA
jgi:RNA polymerase sigma factor (sigma-70 family)